MPLSSVKFDLEKTSILLYDACEVDEGGSASNDYSFSSSRSEEVSFKTNTDRVIKACRQELQDDVEDVKRRDCGIKRRFDMDHLISSISINKNMVSKDLLTSVTSYCVKIMTNKWSVRLQAQILARKQVVRAVLDEQARQRQCNRFDQTLIAMASMAYSRDSVGRARMIGFSNHERYMSTRNRESGHPR